MKRFSLLIFSLIVCLLSSVSAALAEGQDGGALNFNPAPATDSPPSQNSQPALVTLNPAAATSDAAPPAPIEQNRPSAAPISPSPSADALNFSVPAASPAPPSSPSPISSGKHKALPLPSTPLFTGGSESLVARTVGHAEGTRTADGSKTRAYRGHVDPGNGVWNLGSFSFQHCREARYNCSTPEAADEHQLRRLQQQAEVLRQRASALGMELNLEEELNGIDLANQAPLAALGQPEAYPEHLARAKQMGLSGEKAILEGRVWGYWNARSQRWDAPGLGNTEANIRYDQNRRMQAIASALAAYQRQPVARREQLADQIIGQNLSP